MSVVPKSKCMCCGALTFIGIDGFACCQKCYTPEVYLEWRKSKDEAIENMLSHNKKSNPEYCSACGVPWIKHLGIAGTCAENKRLSDIIQRARAKFCEEGSDGAIAAAMFAILGESNEQATINANQLTENMSKNTTTASIEERLCDLLSKTHDARDRHRMSVSCDHPRTCGACHFYSGAIEALSEILTGQAGIRERITPTVKESLTVQIAELQAELDQWQEVAHQLARVVEIAEGHYMPEGSNPYRMQSKHALEDYEELKKQTGGGE